MPVRLLRDVTSAAGGRYTVYAVSEPVAEGEACAPWVGKVRRSNGSVAFESAELSGAGAREWVERKARQVEAMWEKKRRR